MVKRQRPGNRLSGCCRRRCQRNSAGQRQVVRHRWGLMAISDRACWPRGGRCRATRENASLRSNGSRKRFAKSWTVWIRRFCSSDRIDTYDRHRNNLREELTLALVRARTCSGGATPPPSGHSKWASLVCRRD